SGARCCTQAGILLQRGDYAGGELGGAARRGGLRGRCQAQRRQWIGIDRDDYPVLCLQVGTEAVDLRLLAWGGLVLALLAHLVLLVLAVAPAIPVLPVVRADAQLIHDGIALVG